MFRRQFSLVCCTAALVGIVGCSDDGSLRNSRVRVGTATMSDVVFGAIVEDTISVYVCGGDQTYDTHTRWFRDGEVDGDGKFEMTLDGWRVNGQVDSNSIHFTYSDPDGHEIDLDGEGVSENGIEGLYADTIDGCTTGLVVWGDSKNDAQGTWCNADQSQFAQVIVLEPFELTSAGIHVQVTKPGGTIATFYVKPV